MTIRATCTALAALVLTGIAGPAPAQDTGLLFWSPERREAQFRNMTAIQAHGPVSRGDGPVRALPVGTPLDLDIEAHMQAERVAGVLVIQDGQIRLERYGLGMTAADPWVSFSMTKSLTSTLVGAAIRDGYIESLDDPITDYIPEMAGGGYEGVTLRQLLTMTSGVQWNEDYADPNSDVARMLTTPPEPGLDATVSYMRGRARVAEPGTRWHYSTGETNLVGVLVARATGRPLSQYLAETIWSRAGMEQDAAWAMDAQGSEIGGCCVSATLRDWGRVGLMALEDGVVGGTRIVPEGWFGEATRKQADIGTPGRGYGYQWWTRDPDQFEASGIFGQWIHVDPSRRMVVVVLSAWPTAIGPDRSRARFDLLSRIRAAVDN